LDDLDVDAAPHRSTVDDLELEDSELGEDVHAAQQRSTVDSLGEDVDAALHGSTVDALELDDSELGDWEVDDVVPSPLSAIGPPPIPGPAGNIQSLLPVDSHTLLDHTPLNGSGLHSTFRVSAAWTTICYELDELRLSGEYDIRTTIGDVRAAQAFMPSFSLGAHSPSIAVFRCLPEKPYLAVRILELELGCLNDGADLSCTVEDETGSMEGTVDARVLHEYGSRIQRGTCLVLCNPPIFPVAAWSHHLIIHLRSLALLRSPDDPPLEPPSSSIGTQDSA